MGPHIVSTHQWVAGVRAGVHVVIVMCGPSLESRGGISTVVRTYEEAGILRRLNVRYLVTYRDGSGLYKVVVITRCFYQLLALMMTGRVTLVHLHTASRTSFMRKMLLGRVAALFGVPYLVHIHSGEFLEILRGTYGPLRRALSKWLLRKAAALVVLTPGWARQFRDQIGHERILVLPNPLVRSVGSSQPRLQTAGHLRVLFLGAMTRKKGFFDLLEALAAIDGNRTPLHLRCAGVGDEKQIADRCESLGLTERVSVLGWIDEERRTRELEWADVLVLPSYYEGQPMVILEAMSAGVVVVASGVGGIPETLADGEEGLLVQPGDVTALARALERLATSPELRCKMAAKAMARVARAHNPTEIEAKLRSLYADVLC